MNPHDVGVLITQLDPELPPPAYENPGDAGLDLRTREHITLAPGARASVPTGVSLALPRGYVGLVCPRSGLAMRSGLGLVNGPGVIDAGYRGEICVILINHDLSETILLERGDRIAQLLVMPIAAVRLVAVESLPGSHRGAAGFGSTGGFRGPGT